MSTVSAARNKLTKLFTPLWLHVHFASISTDLFWIINEKTSSLQHFNLIIGNKYNQDKQHKLYILKINNQ